MSRMTLPSSQKTCVNFDISNPNSVLVGNQSVAASSNNSVIPSASVQPYNTVAHLVSGHSPQNNIPCNSGNQSQRNYTAQQTNSSFYNSMPHSSKRSSTIPSHVYSNVISSSQIQNSGPFPSHRSSSSVHTSGQFSNQNQVTSTTMTQNNKSRNPIAPRFLNNQLNKNLPRLSYSNDIHINTSRYNAIYSVPSSQNNASQFQSNTPRFTAPRFNNSPHYYNQTSQVNYGQDKHIRPPPIRTNSVPKMPTLIPAAKFVESKIIRVKNPAVCMYFYF